MPILDERLFLGVDAGGSKTDAVLATASRRVVSRIAAPGANVATLGIDKACHVLSEAAKAAMQGASPVGAFFGVAGTGVADNAKRLADALRAALPDLPVSVDTDIRCVIEAADVDGPCVAAILGTGNCVFADDGDGALHRFGGWGWLFDGAGSGFDLGRDAIHHRLAVDDGLAPPSILSDAVGRKLGRRAFDCIPALQSGDRSAVAAFAPLVFNAAEAGDGTAAAIIERNMARVASLVAAARAKHPKAAAGPLVLGGGLCARASMLGPALQKALGSDAPRFIFPDKAPVFGAVRRAVRLFG